MKKLLTLWVTLTLLTLSGCDDAGAVDDDDAPVEIKMNMPEALKDCRTFRVSGDRGVTMLVTRCPSSVTTTHSEIGTAAVTDATPTEEAEK